MQADLQIKTALFGLSAASAATGLGKFLVEGMPKAFAATKSLPKMIGAGAGLGALQGAASAEEGQKGQGALKGALIGGTLGAVGAGAAKRFDFGKNIVRDFTPAGKRLMELGQKKNLTFTQLADRGAQIASKNLSEQWTPVAKGSKKQLQTMWGTQSKAEFQVQPRTMLAKGIGTMGEAWTGFRTKGIKGIGDVLKKDFQQSRYFTKEIGGKTYAAKRSGLGQVVNPLMTSGIGMGVTEGLSTTNDDGTKASLGKKIRKGTTSALGWGLAPPVMAGKLIYDTSKSFMGGQRPQQDLNY